MSPELDLVHTAHKMADRYEKHDPRAYRVMDLPNTRRSGKGMLFFAFLLSAITAGVVASSIFAPNVYRSVISFFSAFVRLEFSLFGIQAESDCRPLFGMVQAPPSLQKFCTNFVDSLNGKRLVEFANIACATDNIFQIIGANACDAAQTLLFFSYFLTVTFLLGAVLQLLAAFAIIAFFLVERSSMTRNSIMVLQTLSGFFCLMGFVTFFANRGFNIDFQVVPLLVADVSPFDLGEGFLVILLALFLAIMSPMLTMCLIPSWMTTEGQIIERQIAEEKYEHERRKNEFRQIIADFRDRHH